MEPEQNKSTEPQVENTFPAATETGSKNTMLVGVSAVVIILAGLGWYMLQSMNTPQTPAPVAETATPEAQAPAATVTATATPEAPQDAATAALSTQGTSDEITAIDADLKATDLNSLNDVNKI